ncbi:hypothetical protein ACFW04_007968 [Cataglyphis niger]
MVSCCQIFQRNNAEIKKKEADKDLKNGDKRVTMSASKYAMLNQRNKKILFMSKYFGVCACVCV